MPADLKNAFAESCCDGGATSLDDRSCQPCGCDKGAGWVCERHREAVMAGTVPAMGWAERRVQEHPAPVRTGTAIAEVKAFRQALFSKSMEMIDKKGADYNRDQQQAGDTLFNLRVCEILGVVPSAEEGILVRLSDKLMRLISLTKPGRDAAVKDESVLDTIADVHNYCDYLGLIWLQRRNNKTGV